MNKTTFSFILLILLAVVMFVVNLFFGSIHLDAAEVINALLGRDSESVTSFVVVQSRLPQAITALL